MATSDTNMSAVMDVLAAAARCGLSVSTLNKLRLVGGGPRFAKLGRAVRYRVADIDAWIEASLRSSTSQQGGSRAA
jgi:predicted DNA-binding transcriptional regulator AlpA